MIASLPKGHSFQRHPQFLAMLLFYEPSKHSGRALPLWPTGQWGPSGKEGIYFFSPTLYLVWCLAHILQTLHLSICHSINAQNQIYFPRHFLPPKTDNGGSAKAVIYKLVFLRPGCGAILKCDALDPYKSKPFGWESNELTNSVPCYIVS